ncbi:Xenobiotic-transporting ATPase protein [Dioscorea alata]|uniref:Xenobiotic-transporting ATPase protein n=1 Tax=Dioscorea alata TaxID=55571 RepID=A0ACB7V1Z1_DIOAL|nr:Xenobiotic-transporting ATPase protein [Dioscorea alata]
MAIGTIGAIGDGMSTPITLLVTSLIMNELGAASSSSPSFFIEKINKNAVALLYIACGLFASAFLEGYCWARTGQRQASRMRNRYLKAILRQDIAYFDLKIASTTEVITSISSDSLVIQDVISEKIPNFLMNFTVFIGGYIVGFFMLWRLALIALPTVLLLIIPGIMYGRILIGIASKIREEYNKAGHIAEQAISSIRTVHSFVGEKKMVAEFSAALEGSIKLGLRQGLIKGIAVGSNSIIYSIWAFLLWYSSKLVINHDARGGTIFGVGTITIAGGIAFGTSLSNLKYVAEASAAAGRISEVVNRVPKIDSESNEGEILQSITGEVEFKDIKFAYPSRPETIVLNEFNLKVPAGKTLALVGSSGSGKSTVISLLQRFYDPINGSILLDGVDIQRLKLKWLRSQLGLVSQEPALFATSIKENILFGKEDASMEDVMAACKTANVHDFISQLPLGYDTQVGERGIQLSGGQKQRIAIARAVLRSPKILLLDEATSALDTESERIVQEAIDIASIGRTTIIIAHRLSTILNSDIITVVQAGRVVESGSHNELMCDENGIYSPLVKLQQTPVRVRREEEQFTSNIVLESSSSRKVSQNGSIKKLLSIVSRGNSVRSIKDYEEENKQEFIDSSVPSFWRLLCLNAPEWKNGVIGCLNAVFFGAIQPLYGYSLGSILAVFFLKDHEEIKTKTRTYCLTFAFLSLLSLLINIGQHYNFGAMGEHVTKRVRELLLQKMLTFEVGWFEEEENSTGALCSRLAKDATMVRSLVGDRMALIIQTFSSIIIAFVLALITSWRLAIVLISIQPLITLSFYARPVFLKKMLNKTIQSQSESSKLAVEAVSNIRTITVFSSQDQFLELFQHSQKMYQNEDIKQSWFAGIGLGLSLCLMRLTWALAFWYSAKLLSRSQITAKTLFQTFLILVSTSRIIAEIGSMATDITRGTSSIAYIFKILDRRTKIEPEDSEGYCPEKIIGNVDIQNVDFAYPTRPNQLVFTNFSLSIEARKSTAIVGPSGCGKSTIVCLIERFYDPLLGKVKIDGRDIKSYNLSSLRKHIALVSQEPMLFSGTVRENITYGTEVATEGEIENAAKLANAHEFISSLKDGYETLCGDRGLQLSGGQKQRIAIARAILKNPAILLLDEATSALDSWSEKIVQETLERVMIGRTCVVVAHRLSTVQNCDLIVVLEKGKILEKGTHDSLLAVGPSGAYFALVNLQQGPLSPEF